MVRLIRAFNPSRVLKPATASSGDAVRSSGVAACAVGESPKQASASGMISKPRRKGDGVIELVVIGFGVVDLNRFIVRCSFFSRWLTLRLLEV